MLLRPLPGLAEPDRVVDIGRTQNGAGFDTVSYPNCADFRRRSTMFEDVYAIRLEPQPMGIAGAKWRRARVTAQSRRRRWSCLHRCQFASDSTAVAVKTGLLGSNRSA